MLFTPRGRAKMGAIVLTLAAVPAFAESPAPALQDPQATSITLLTIEVISEQLEAARLQIQPSLGASTYYFGSKALQSIPQGENAPLNQVLLQMPAVAQDSFGQIHVRGEHANVQFRIDGVELPKGFRFSGRRSNPLRPQRFAPYRRSRKASRPTPAGGSTTATLCAAASLVRWIPPRSTQSAAIRTVDGPLMNKDRRHRYDLCRI